MPRLNKIVKRITFINEVADGSKFEVVADMRNYGKKKKSSKLLRPMEKLMRRLSKTQARSALIYAQRHEISSRKRKNGWMRDMVPNLTKAHRKAWKSTK